MGLGILGTFFSAMRGLYRLEYRVVIMVLSECYAGFFYGSLGCSWFLPIPRGSYPTPF